MLIGEAKPKPTGGVFQFKITLLGFKPLIWGRIRVPDCMLELRRMRNGDLTNSAKASGAMGEILDIVWMSCGIGPDEQ